jgi:hypothetical protein
MKKVLTIVGVARSNPAWAGSLLAPAQSQPASGVNLMPLDSAQPSAIVVTGSGSYLIGGICKVDIEYKATGLKDNVDAEVPVSVSSKVPFSGEGELYYPGCHIVHFKADKIVDEARTEDGSWKVCFAQRPDIAMVIYYYLDNPPGGSPVWIALPTVKEDGYACSTAPYTGVYMPAGKVDGQAGGVGDAIVYPPPIPGPGTVQPPLTPNTITKSGSYSMGGICTLLVNYKIAKLSDLFYVELPVQDDKTVTFPDNGDILFLPGCHLLHFERNILQEHMGNEKGTWEICFAALPNKHMTIYYYESLIHKDHVEEITPPWNALPTTTKNGMACAPAEFTGVYTPGGH